MYKGKILLDEKLINFYNIENDHNIILVKKEIQKSEESLNQKIKNYYLKMINLNKSNNKEIKLNDILNFYNNFPDIISLINNLDFNQFDNIIQLLGVEALKI